MTMKIEGADGEEIEVYTAEEVQTRETAAAAAKEAEYVPKLTALEEELGGAKTALATRANEFSQFRKLSDEQVAALAEKDRLLYENGLALNQANEDRAAAEKKNKDDAVTAAIKAKAGTNTALEAKMTEMWPLIGVEANTPEEIQAKTMMVLGAISTTTPDLVATVAGFTGSFAPPGAGNGGEGDGKTFADSDKGKALAADLGFKL